MLYYVDGRVYNQLGINVVEHISLDTRHLVSYNDHCTTPSVVIPLTKQWMLYTRTIPGFS